MRFREGSAGFVAVVPLLRGDQLPVGEVVDPHRGADLFESRGGGGACGGRTGFEHVVDLADALLVFGAAAADRVERLVEDGDEELLDLHVAQTASAVVGLQFVERGVVRQMAGEVLRTAEGVEVGEDRVALDPARVLHAQVVRVGVHAHHLLAHLLGRIAQVDAVAERFGHLGLAVGAREPLAGGVRRKQDFGCDERRAVERVEFVDDFARLLDHRLLILARRHGRGLEGRDVRRLTDRVGEEADGDALTLLRVALRSALRETAELDLGLHGRIALQALHRNEVHVVERQFAQLGNLRLYEKGRFRRVEAARKVVERNFQHVAAHLFGVVRVVGECLRIRDHDEYALEPARILQFDAAAQRTDVMSEVELSGGAVARQDDFSHIFIVYAYSGPQTYEKLRAEPKNRPSI